VSGAEEKMLRHQNVELATLCTLELGGKANALLDVGSEAEAREALRWAAHEHLDVAVMGSGSNLVIADAGVAGAVLRVSLSGFTAQRHGEEVRVTAAAGTSWDELVAHTIAEGWQGLECLSGVPGTVGASPIQNIGAYGQEVGDRIRAVRVVERPGGAVRELSGAECGLGYRDSVFRRQPGRWVVLAVTFTLTPGAAPELRYAELARAAGARAAQPSLATVRETVLELRRGKGMLHSAEQPCHSVGSFFVNPVLAATEAARVLQVAVDRGHVGDQAEVPSFAAGEGRLKLSAAWLIERAAFPRGTRRGAVGLSPHHALALVHHGGGTAAELVAFASDIRAAVRTHFDVDLRPEPVFWGFPTPDPTL
jgi:UDP-N-acetylmuramate dehydrogenase